MNFPTKALFLCLFLSLAGLNLPAQVIIESEQELPPAATSDSSQILASSIKAADIRQHLMVLASDEYEGRETGTPGNQKAAEYIARHFKSLGLPPIGDDDSYFQKVAFTWTQWEDISLTIDGKDYRHLWDFLSFPTLCPDLPAFDSGELLFLGYGIDDDRYSDYRNTDVAGKVLLIYQGEPMDESGRSLLTGTEATSEWSSDWKRKLEVAKDKGAEAVLFIEHQLQQKLSENRRFLVGPRLTLGRPDPEKVAPYAPHAFISTTMAEALMGKRKKKVIKTRKKVEQGKGLKPVKLKTDFRMAFEKNQKVLEGQNVLGYVEGKDPKLKDELVVVTGHYDHLGRRGDDIYNGADDNGSGTSTVLDIAEAFAMAQKEGLGPRRSVLFMLVTGEEKGLLGSRYYVEYPVFPLENTIANVNVDMIGRVDEAHADNPEYIYVIGSDRLSTELHEINETANREYTGLELDYTYNAEDDPNRYYYRSDHYNFAERGIPAIFYFSGVHEDYHRTTDTPDKIMFYKTAKIGRLIFHTTWELANRDKRIVVDVKQ